MYHLTVLWVRYWGGLTWVLYAESHKSKIKVSTKLGSYMGVLEDSASRFISVVSTTPFFVVAGLISPVFHWLSAGCCSLLP